MRKILLWCASLAVLGLAACDSSTSSDSSSTPSELVGIWKDSAKVGAEGAVVYLQLKDGGVGFAKAYTFSGRILNDTDTATGTWKVSGNKLIVNATLGGSPLNDTAAYTVSGSTLTLSGSILAAAFSLPTNTVFTKAAGIVAPKF